MASNAESITTFVIVRKRNLPSGTSAGSLSAAVLAGNIVSVAELGEMDCRVKLSGHSDDTIAKKVVVKTVVWSLCRGFL